VRRLSRMGLASTALRKAEYLDIILRSLRLEGKDDVRGAAYVTPEG